MTWEVLTQESWCCGDGIFAGGVQRHGKRIICTEARFSDVMLRFSWQILGRYARVVVVRNVAWCINTETSTIRSPNNKYICNFTIKKLNKRRNLPMREKESENKYNENNQDNLLNKDAMFVSKVDYRRQNVIK